MVRQYKPRSFGKVPSRWLLLLLLFLVLPALATLTSQKGRMGFAYSAVVGYEGGSPCGIALFAKQAEANQPRRQEDTTKPLPPDHNHPAFKERVKERLEMVVEQISARDVKDPNVLKAMRIVPRHAFIPIGQQPYAYGDHPLPIGEGQTISQPYIVAFMTEALKLKPTSKVLEIGTGSGYQAAVCAEIAREVYTIEIVEALAKSAGKKLKELGYKNIFVRAGDGYFGWKEKGPYDAIIGTAAAGRVPPPLLEQLKPGGRMILPYEDTAGFQYLVLITKDTKGSINRRNIMPVRFVPMTGQVEKPEPKK